MYNRSKPDTRTAIQKMTHYNKTERHYRRNFHIRAQKERASAFRRMLQVIQEEESKMPPCLYTVIDENTGRQMIVDRGILDRMIRLSSSNYDSKNDLNIVLDAELFRNETKLNYDELMMKRVVRQKR